jgi:general secretion pathway protein L
MRVLGIDLGGHSVKLAEVEVGFQSAQVVQIHLATIGLGLTPLQDRSLAVLKEMLPSLPPIDAVAAAFPGDRALLRLLEIPFTEAKKIAAVVGNELADDLPWELDDVIYDHIVLPIAKGKVLAAAARKGEVGELLAALSEVRLESRSLPLTSLSYAGLVRRLDPDGTVAVLDLGHFRSHICFVQNGRSLLARTLSRAGHQITEAFQQAYQLSYLEAEAFKEREALLVVDGVGGLHSAQQQNAEITVQALTPLVRELRLTLGLFSSKLTLRPDRILLCGGTSLIRGLDSYLSVELGVPCERLSLDGAANLRRAELVEAAEVIGCLSLSLALDQGSRQGIDLRQGEFSYRRDTSIFKDKMLSIAISIVTVLVFAALSAYMSLYSLRQEEKVLLQQLKRSTQTVFGEVVTNPSEVSRRVKLSVRDVNAGIPQKTAFDILHALSVDIPGTDKVKLDITKLEIKQGKTYLTGTADSRSAVGDIVKALEKNKCFSKVGTGTISDVSEGKKQFSLTITTSCF